MRATLNGTSNNACYHCKQALDMLMTAVLISLDSSSFIVMCNKTSNLMHRHKQSRGVMSHVVLSAYPIKLNISSESVISIFIFLYNIFF